MKDLVSQLGYDFEDKTLLKKAITHKSFSSENNERLEFLGDALLNLYVAEYLYKRFETLDEGKLTDSGGKLHEITGLTLGLSDLDKINSLGSYFNTS